MGKIQLACKFKILNPSVVKNSLINRRLITSGGEMGTTRFNWQNLKNWVGTQNEPKRVTEQKTVLRSELVKVGGLYRIRENYEPVWRLEAGEDGRSYLVRVGEEGAEERLFVAEDDTEANYSKAANKVAADSRREGITPRPMGYRTLEAGQVHVVWECDKCNAPNITKEGNKYECGQCHHSPADVLSAHPQPEVYDRSGARAIFGDWVVERMKREGITRINKNLIEVWAAEYQPKTGEPCSCKPGVQRDNCPTCEGTGIKIDFAAIRSRSQKKAGAKEKRYKGKKITYSTSGRRAKCKSKSVDVVHDPNRKYPYDVGE